MSHEFNCYVVFAFAKDEVHDIVEPSVLGVFTDVQEARNAAWALRKNAKSKGLNVRVCMRGTVMFTDKFLV